MAPFDLRRRIAAEALGTGLLAAAVVGSGIMGERLAGGNDAVALLANTVATGAILVVLVLVLGPVSGAHLNPAVTAALCVRRLFPAREIPAYAAAQLAGGALGTLAAHFMFGEPAVAWSTNVRAGPPQWGAEAVAAFGLVAAVLGCLRFRPSATPWAVGLFISAGYWFTSSTSFANPAVAVARSLTDTFSGIRPADVPAFVAAELAGALLAALVMGWLLAPGGGRDREGAWGCGGAGSVVMRAAAGGGPRRGGPDMRIAVPDLVSNSYFPAPAAVELGFFAKEGLEAGYELIFPVDAANRALRDGDVDLVAGSAHSTLAAFPEWRGAKLLCALSQGMYWLLVARADLGVAPGDVRALEGLRVGAAPWVDLGLKRLLAEAGLDPDRDLRIAPVPGAAAPGASFGVTAARALEDGLVDAFWANGMGAELAVARGAGAVVLDPRRGLGPAGAFGYTQPVLAATEAAIDRDPDAVAAAVRAVVGVQKALREDVALASEVGRRCFPEEEAGLIAGVVARDLPFYDAAITEGFVESMNAFARGMGLPAGGAGYDDVVAAGFRGLWS